MHSWFCHENRMCFLLIWREHSANYYFNSRHPDCTVWFSVWCHLLFFSLAKGERLGHPDADHPSGEEETRGNLENLIPNMPTLSKSSIAFSAVCCRKDAWGDKTQVEVAASRQAMTFATKRRHWTKLKSQSVKPGKTKASSLTNSVPQRPREEFLFLYSPGQVVSIPKVQPCVRCHTLSVCERSLYLLHWC